MFHTITDSIARRLEHTQNAIDEFLFEPVIRLGVTGLSRAGKTVFITSLVANLLDRGRMPQFLPHHQGRIKSVFLQPQPDDGVPRFEYEDHIAALKSPTPRWPEGTRSISQLRVSIKYQPAGFFSSFTGLKTLHLDIVDYPGEWLLDLPLLSMSYTEWSEKTLKQAKDKGRKNSSVQFLSELNDIKPNDKLNEQTAQNLAASFTEYLRLSREEGFSACAPGRFLMPGDLAGSPALTFCPLPAVDKVKSRSLYAANKRRYEAYKRIVVRPFFRDHFSRVDRQIVLIDILSAINKGPQAVEDLRVAMADVLSCFKPGKNSWLSSILTKRVEKILFAGTKVDYLNHVEHPKLTAIIKDMVRGARERAEFSGAKTGAMSIASLRVTVEKTVKHDGEELPCVQGTLLDTGKSVVLYAGELPDDPSQLLVPAREGVHEWLNAEYQMMDFAPSVLTLKSGDGPPHIRLDRVAQFLLGDRLS